MKPVQVIFVLTGMGLFVVGQSTQNSYMISNANFLFLGVIAIHLILRKGSTEFSNKANIEREVIDDECLR